MGPSQPAVLSARPAGSARAEARFSGGGGGSGASGEPTGQRPLSGLARAKAKYADVWDTMSKAEQKAKMLEVLDEV